MSGMFSYTIHPDDYLKMQRDEINREIAHYQMLREVSSHRTGVLQNIESALQAFFHPVKPVKASVDRNQNQSCCPRTATCCG